MKTKTKQTSRTGTESEKWTSHGGFGGGGAEKGGKVRGIRSINGRYKRNRGRLSIL